MEYLRVTRLVEISYEQSTYSWSVKLEENPNKLLFGIRANTEGAFYLVADDCQEVDVEVSSVDFHFTDGLCRVRVSEDARTSTVVT